MTQQIINIGAGPNDGTGDQLRVSFDKCNQNFTELYTTGAATATEGIWNFNQTSTDTTTAPASGRFRTNSGNAATATQFAIHRISINGFDRADTLRTQYPGDIIKLQDKANADSWARFIVQAIPVDNVDWFQVNVAFDNGGGTAPGNNQEILFTFAASSGGGAGGNVIAVGTPTNGQLAQWTDATHIQGIASSSLGFASLASPVFTGDPQAPTPATADNDTSIATTAFVKTQNYLTANQAITLSSDVTGSGTTAITTTIANNAVSNAKLADVPTATFKGRTTAATGDPEDLTVIQATALLNVFTNVLKGLAPASGGGTTNFLRADATWAAPAGSSADVIPACGRLAYSSATLLSFTPFGGDRIKINGTIYPIPSAGIAGLANTSVFVNGTAGQNLAASTSYYVYAFNNAGTITADFSTTGRATSGTAGNVGIEIKSGDDTRSVIGMVHTNASSQFVNSFTQRFVRSWFNRQSEALGMSNAFTAQRSTTSASFVELNAEIRCEYLVWLNESVAANISGMMIPSSGSPRISNTVGWDGVADSTHQCLADCTTGLPVGLSVATTHSGTEGYHWVTYMGLSSGGLTANFGSGTVFNAISAVIVK